MYDILFDWFQWVEWYYTLSLVQGMVPNGDLFQLVLGAE
jgi:hypothetical protein